MADVTWNSAESRFEISIGGEVVGFSTYQLVGDEIVFIHTQIDPDRGERGLGSQLVKAELDDIRENTDLRVIPQCPFVASYIRKHPEYEDLLRR